MFDIKGKNIVLATEDLAIPPFKDHYNNAKDKQQALKEIEYIIWLYKWNTPYEAYPEKERAEKVRQDVFGDSEWEESDSIRLLAKRFLEFQETPGTRLLQASRTAADSLTEALGAYSENGMDIDTAIKVTRILKDVGNIVKSLDLAMKQAKAEQADAGRVKGGGQLGLYE